MNPIVEFTVKLQKEQLQSALMLHNQEIEEAVDRAITASIENLDSLISDRVTKEIEEYYQQALDDAFNDDMIYDMMYNFITDKIKATFNRMIEREKNENI